MLAIMNLGYETAIYLLIALIAVPALLWRPHYTLYILVFLILYQLENLIQFSIGHVNVYTKDFCVLLYTVSLAIVLIKNALSKRDLINMPSGSRNLMLLVLAYLSLHFFYLISAIFYGVPIDTSIRRFLKYFDVMYFFLPFIFLRNEKRMKHLLAFIVIISCLFPVWQSYLFTLTHTHSITSSNTLRVAGGSVVPILAMAVYAILIWGRGIKQYVLVAVPLVSIVLTGHRSATISILAGFYLLFLWMRQFGKSLLFLYVTSTCFLIVVIALNFFLGYDFLGDVLKRGSDIYDITNRTTLSRWYAIRDNFHIFLSRPIFGIGYNHEVLGNLFRHYSQQGGVLSAEFNVLHPHNIVMRFLSHTGVIGTSLISLVIGTVLKQCYFCITRDVATRYAGIFLFCSITSFLIMCLMNPLFGSQGFVFWTLCGLVALLYEKASPMEDRVLYSSFRLGSCM